jgi:molybdenum cofactor synthesis domain-containing protein
MSDIITVTAAVLLIGDEILSGRTQDTNLKTISTFIAPLGVQVKEVRVVPDEPGRIVEALNALRVAYDYVLTTGGIGPTHDDKTADAVAEAFGVPIDVRDDAKSILVAHYGGEDKLNEARLRMARIPQGSTLIANPVSKAPGFQIDNVFVMAGVPSIMRGMLEDVAPRLVGGSVMQNVSIRCKGLREGDLAAGFAEIEQRLKNVSLGSYPWFIPGGDYGVHLVARSQDPEALERAREETTALAISLGAVPEPQSD